MAKRRTFTLVELLITMAIIAIMATITLFALYSPRDNKAAKTRALIAKLDRIIQQRYEGFVNRRVLISPVPPDNLGTGPYANGEPAKWFAPVGSSNCLRELMRLELPERHSDYLDAPITKELYWDTSNAMSHTLATSTAVMAVPALTSQYRASYQPTTSDEPTINKYQGSEVLYLIISTTFGDDGALDKLPEWAVGDKDGDGLKEILDAWGMPIRFLRWAPGFVSELQKQEQFTDGNSNGRYDSGESFVDYNGDGVWTPGAPDPFDPLHVYPTDPADSKPQIWSTFKLVPLIYSAGPDKEYDILSDRSSTIHYRRKTTIRFCFPAAKANSSELWPTFHPIV